MDIAFGAAHILILYGLLYKQQKQAGMMRVICIPSQGYDDGYEDEYDESYETYEEDYSSQTKR